MDFVKLFEKVPEALVVLSPEPEYKILAATDYYLQITMRKREDILGLKFLLEAFPEKDVPYEQNPVRKSLDIALNTKKVDYLDVTRYDLTKPDGSYEVRYWEASHTPVLDAAGNVEYIIQHTSDVTEREQAKHALDTSQKKFQFMAEAMPQLIFTTDGEGNLTYFNKRWEEYTGIPLEKLMQENWHEIIHPDDLQSTMEKWETAFKAGEAMRVELRKRDKEGVYRWHLCRSLPMKDADGNITMWVGSSTDIHDTRKMVQELLYTNEQMAILSDQVQLAFEKAESERQTLEKLIMKAPAIFCVLEGPEHRFKLVNENYQMLFPKRDLIGKSVAEALPEVIEQGFIDLLDTVYTTGKEFVAEEVPIKLDRQDNGLLEEVYLTFIYQAMYTSDKVTGILVFAYEVTDQVIFKKKLQEIGHV
ncbi:PAS domain-containing protein [Pontibacter sp. KCTC 32443]|uniref:PAS domain-containing protein n=1 Tax=Pontibacter TaxID=323449 RepID=UPI00164D9BC2|nr:MULTISPECIES: PAS domain-containing protein [Pontibacter]MBC5775086.1 PAS domain-containing protein [Pontibacter sp. KCTC 32443]